VEVFNSVYKKAKADGKSDKDAETLAFKEANGVVKEGKSMTMKLERRLFAAQIRSERGAGKEPSKMVGYAAVFNSDSEDLGGFKEQIAPGAFTRALNDKQDVRALFNHDPNHILGRTKSGTLTLKQDEDGLNFECLMPDTQTARDLMTSLERGDIDQCSFGFMVRGEQWYDEKGKEVSAWRGSRRVITDCDLFDVSAVTYPAYPATSVQARAAFMFPEGKPEAQLEDRTEAKTKKVDGEDLGPHDFIVASDPSDTSTWHLPWHFKSEGKTLTHLRDALARFNQTEFESEEVKKTAHAKLVNLCEAHGIHVADEEKKSAPQANENALALAKAKMRMLQLS
jgi:HK97 family phage prohead protease